MEQITNREQIIHFPKYEDVRGNLTFIEENIHLPFTIQRVYWIYDVPGGEKRGGHAFLNQKEIIISLSGSFDVVIKEGENERRYRLDRSYFGLYVPNLIWRSLDNFSTNSIALVISSSKFKESDYLREFDEFQNILVKKALEGGI